MTADLLSGVVSAPIQALMVLAVAGTAAWRIWVAYRKTVTQEKERTSRLIQALDGASPPQREEVIRACSLLESAASASLDPPRHPAEPPKRPGPAWLCRPCGGACGRDLGRDRAGRSARAKNRCAAPRSRHEDSKTSMTCPC